MNQAPSSPSVRPCRIGISAAPTKLSQPVRSAVLRRAARRVRAVEHPDALAMLGRCFEHVEQGRDVGVDAAAQVLQIDQDRVEGAHRLAGRTADLAIQAEHRDSVGRVGEVRRLHHIVLEVAADAMLRAEHRRQLQSGREKRIDAVGQVFGDGGRMRQQRNALAFERTAQFGVGKQPVDSKQAHWGCLRELRDEAIRVMEIRLVRAHGPAPSRTWCRPSPQGPPRARAPSFFEHRPKSWLQTPTR